MTRAAVELPDDWRAIQADEPLRRAYLEYDLDDRDWARVDVPGSWARHPALAEAHGPVLFRLLFDSPRPPEDDRVWLTFDSVHYQSDVWMDGAYLGDTEGWFFPHSFEITDLLRRRREHCLSVEVASPTTHDGHATRHLLGSLDEHRRTETSLGGITGGVRLEVTGPVRILHHRVRCREVDETRATIAIRAVLDSNAEREVTIRTRIGATEHLLAQTLAAGENQFEWVVTVSDPQRWWPRALGAQPLHDVTVDVLDLAGRDLARTVSDSRTRRIGLRSVELDRGVFRVNSERLFLKGTNLEAPSALGAVDDAPSTVPEAIAAGLDLLRVRAHVAHRSIYRRADEQGLLLWQDLPITGRPHRSMRRQATRQARELVDLLGHHPSVLCWCGRDGGTTVSIVDRPVTRALRRADDSRPVLAHSAGVIPQPDALHADTLYAAIPRLARFVADGPGPVEGSRVETLRRLKYRPTGGFVLGSTEQLPDGILAASCRSVAVIADRLPDHFHGDEALAIDVHAVSDLRRPLDAVIVTARLEWTPAGGTTEVVDERRWTGTVPADDCVRIGTLQVIVPEADGRLDLEVRLDHRDHAAVHTDAAAVLCTLHEH